MSLVSLEKYLYGTPSGTEHNPETSGSTGYYDLTCRLLAGIQDLLLAGKEVDDIGQDLHELRQSLHPDSETASLDLVAQRFEGLLSALKTRSQQANHERSEDFRKIILILNEAFSHVNSGSERSDVRLRHLEKSLQNAAKIDDLRSLKIHLSKMLSFVREEAKKEFDCTQISLQALGSQLDLARKTASRFGGVALASRERALIELAKELTDSDKEEKLYIGIFAADSLRAVTSRHGKEVSERLLVEIAEKQVQGVFPTASLFEWSATTVVSLWRSNDHFADVRDYVANCFKLPTDHRAFVGARVATFSISLRSLVIQGRKDVDEIIWNLDQFGGGVRA